MIAHEFQVAERRRHQQIRLTSLPYQMARYILPVMRIMSLLLYSEHVLRRCGFMIHIERVYNQRRR